MRPWFDWMAVRFVTKWYFPLSRAWAAGLAADGSVDNFNTTLGPVARELRNPNNVLGTLMARRRLYGAANSAWCDAFFGDREFGTDTLVDCEIARFEAAKDLMAMRRAFLSLRKGVSQVNWAVAGPTELQTHHGLRLEAETAAYPAPAPVEIERSRSIPGARGEEFWIRMRSPVQSTGDTAWAHVFMPERRPVRGVVVSLHGVIMEPEMWPLADLSDGLLDRGFCVVRPEAPWHGRRRMAGHFGGEPIFARGLLGFVELFESWVLETALWIRWARGAVSDRVSLGGISLGALTSQIVASVCHHWPEDMRPDGALLITTTGDLVDGALRGSLLTMLGVMPRLEEAGWTEADIDHWRPLVETGETPALDPDRIIMALGDVDTVTPFEGGMALARRWNIPPENLFVGHQGHFTTALGLYRNNAPLNRAAEIFAA